MWLQIAEGQALRVEVCVAINAALPVQVRLLAIYHHHWLTIDIGCHVV